MRVIRLVLVSFLACAAVAAQASSAGFGDLEKSLRLTPAQKTQFDVAVGATQRALLSVAFGALQVKDRLAAELAKPHPDLSELARAQDEVVEQSRPLFSIARREWERLYAMLDPDQVATTRAYVEERLGKLEDVGSALRGLLLDRK